MSTRYGDRGFGRYGDSDEDRAEERDYDERDTGRAYGDAGDRYGRGPDYGSPRRGGYPALRGGEHGREREQGSRDYFAREYGSRYGSRDYGTGDYPPRYGREGVSGGYAGPAARRQEGEDYGRDYAPRAYGRDAGRDYERGRARVAHHDDDDGVRDYDTDYGRTTSRFYGRSGYEYGRDDYDRPNYGPEITEHYSRRHDERGDRRDVRDARDEHEERDRRGRGGRGWWDRAADEVLAWFGDDEAARRRRAESGRGGERGAGEGRGAGLYRGRGPKNYRRPDERIREEINDRLTDNDWLDASDVDVSVVNGEAVLSGTVDSRYSKRLAEDIAESVTGVSNVQNNLRVQSYQTGAPSAATRDALTPTSDETVAASDAPTFTDVIKNAVTSASTTTPEVEGSTGTDAPPTNTRASRAGGRG
jgi:osmotically-inducible protein OsmY